jgi:dihydropteroate synthase
VNPHEAELLHNPRVIAGTFRGFEGFRRIRSPLIDPLRALLPVAVECAAVTDELRGVLAPWLRGRGFYVDERECVRGVVRIAGALDRFETLERADEIAPPPTPLPAPVHGLVTAIGRCVRQRFVERFALPWRGGVLELGGRPRVMGIVNVTPDSFSDGGSFHDPDKAIEHALELERAGADLIDVGAESTRPGAHPVAHEEEIRRIAPVIKALAQRLRIPLSIDTTKAVVADAMIELGAAMVNDVSGLDADPAMADVVARRRALVVVNHMRGTPRTMQQAPRYDDVVADVVGELRARMDRARRAGIAEDRIVLDPGIGFGKRAEDNLELLARVGELKSLGRPLLVGCSRKSFLGRVTGKPTDRREAATAATTALAHERGVHIVRVHDVDDAVDVLKVLDAIDDPIRLA